MKRLRTWLIGLRVLAVSAVLLSGVLLAPYVALPNERITWQRFAGLYGYNPPTPVPMETATPSETVTETGTATPEDPGGTTTTETATSSKTAMETETATVTRTISATASPSVTATSVVSGSLPDLVVSRLRIELETGGSCNYTSTALGLRVTISNQGTADVTHPFTLDVNGVGLRLDGSVVPHGGSVSVWVGGHRGLNTVTVDSLNEIAESNENNNTRSEQVPIPTLPRTCTPTSATNPVTATPATPTTRTPTETATATPTGTITATGTATTTANLSVPPRGVISGDLPDLYVSDMRVELETGGACNYSSTALGLRFLIDNGGTASVQSPFTLNINGAQLRVDGRVIGPGEGASFWTSGYVYMGVNTVTVDSLNEITESDESNNTRSEEIFAIPTLPPMCPTTPAVGTYKKYLPDVVHR